jgi:N,N-dimethylglycine/sarcosine dehydrogenase ferredoxin subunit
MIGISAPGCLMLASVALFVGGGLWRARRWLAGQSAPLDRLGLFKLPRRYLVDVHHVVARDRYVAKMHRLAAGGFVAAVLLILLVHVFGIGSDWLALLLLIACIVMAMGALMAAMRRWETAATQLSRGAFERLPYALFAFGFFFALASAPQAGFGEPIEWQDIGGFVLLVIGAWGCWELFAGMSVGPMRHAFAGALHLAFHPHPARFAPAAREVALQPLALGASKRGVETPADFRWNQLLSFDACVQCGRCEAACPAFAAEQPLNPKKLIQDLANALGPGKDSRYAGSPHPGRPVGLARGGRTLALVGPDAMIHPDTLWSCTTCRACVYECPMMIEHVDAVIDLRRFQTIELRATPGKAVDALAGSRAAGNPGGQPLAGRLDWAADLALPVMARKREADVLLWLGDGAFEPRNQHTLRALVELLRRAEIDFAVLGEEELDCGDLARRLGDEATFQDLARRNVATLGRYRFARIVTADPHALNCLKNEYPDFDGRYEVLHHTTLMAGLIADGRLAVASPLAGFVTYHDPCYLGRYNGEIESPRAILGALGVEYVEMERYGLRSSCCGGGGGAPLTDVPGKRRIPDIRMDHARATGASTVAVACPNCAVMLEGVAGPRPAVADIAELLLAAVQGHP